MGEEFKRVENDKIQMNDKTFTKKFVIKFVIFVIILILITSLAIYLTIKNLNKENTNNIKENVAMKEMQNKNEAEDKKYALISYTETYNANDLEIIYYYELNGKTVEEGTEGATHIVKIEGLKDKEIQDEINKKLKEKCYNFQIFYPIVTANFSNILSVSFEDDERKQRSFKCRFNYRTRYSI